MSTNNKCKICNCELHRRNALTVEEMMHGTREKFEYFFCEECNSFQISSLPEDMGKYYSDYYTEKKSIQEIKGMRKKLWRIRSFLAMNGMYGFTKFVWYNSILEWAYYSEINFKSRILDVGCGSGDILYEF